RGGTPGPAGKRRPGGQLLLAAGREEARRRCRSPGKKPEGRGKNEATDGNAAHAAYDTAFIAAGNGGASVAPSPIAERSHPALQPRRDSYCLVVFLLDGRPGRRARRVARAGFPGAGRCAVLAGRG